MTYPETLDYLFTQLPMYQRQGAAAMKKDLTNIRLLLDWLGNPQDRLTCIHVAGTNGKGTVCHLLAAALQQAGYRVGLYTSPHYRDFRERIKIDGHFISEARVTDFTERLRAADLTVAPSFFEITVAMAFDHFARLDPDFCIIEVGLGGRLDSTNIITPLLSVITNIGLDHTQFLGDTLPEIAGEKAGIIKPQVPVVIGRRQAETTGVFTRIAAERDAPIVFAEDRKFDFPADEAHPVRRENQQTALAALEQLDLLGVFVPPPEKIAHAWANLHALTYYIGRFQVLSPAGAGPLCLADSAHNVDGVREAVAWLRGFGKPLHLVLGMVSDKDHDRVLALLPAEARYYFVKADIPRGLAAEALREKAAGHGLHGKAYPSVAGGYAAARAAATVEELVFVGGSIFTVAEVI